MIYYNIIRISIKGKKVKFWKLFILQADACGEFSIL